VSHHSLSSHDSDREGYENSTIQELENDMLAIRAEHETQNRIIQSQKSALGNIIGDLGSLRLMGKDKDTPGSEMPSPVATPPPEHVVNGAGDVILRVESSAEVGGGSHGGEDQASQDDLPSSANLNAAATSSMGHSPAPSSRLALEDDIEMGEVEEERKESPNKGRRNREELEEGEASDISSVLSDPPDD
jgi:THO complex subunit 7